MCHQNCCVHLSAEEAAALEESLLVYCKPVELYNILRRRALHNPSFLRRCLHYKIQAKRRRRLRPGMVVFNYRDCNNMLRKTEGMVFGSMSHLNLGPKRPIQVTWPLDYKFVDIRIVTEGYSCPFCLMQCASFKGLRYHLSSTHDLFNFEFWVTEEYQAVNVSVDISISRSETVADRAAVPQFQTFFFCSRSRRCRPKNLLQKKRHVDVQFLELDSPRLASEGTFKGILDKDDVPCRGEKASKSFPGEKNMQNVRHGLENNTPDCPSSVQCIERVASSSNVPGVTIAMAQSPMDLDCAKPLSGSDPVIPTKTKKTMERSDSRNRMLLQKRQFYHSHRVQPMALQQVLSDRDSEDEVDDDIADLEDRRMLDDFVDVTKDEKQLMHLWNSFVRKQRVLADGHIPWACEAFSKLHGQELVSSQALFWCWRLFLIKLWNHGLLDACTMNSCNIILEEHRDKVPDVRS